MSTHQGGATIHRKELRLAIPTATNSSYSIGSAFMSDADVYDVTVSDGFSTTVSNLARLGV